MVAESLTPLFLLCPSGLAQVWRSQRYKLHPLESAAKKVTVSPSRIVYSPSQLAEKSRKYNGPLEAIHRKPGAWLPLLFVWDYPYCYFIILWAHLLAEKATFQTPTQSHQQWSIWRAGLEVASFKLKKSIDIHWMPCCSTFFLLLFLSLSHFFKASWKLEIEKDY